MKNIKIMLVAAVLAVAGFASKSHAVLSQDLDIKVSINATKSLSAGTTVYDFGALAVNTASHSATAIVITNDSGALIETYEMSAGNALEYGAGTYEFTLAASTGTDKYVLSAQFSTARPADASNSTWSSDNLTGAAVACSATQFGNGTAGQAGVDVSPAGGSNTRNLWFRIITPDVVTSPNPHTATATIAVQ